MSESYAVHMTAYGRSRMPMNFPRQEMREETVVLKPVLDLVSETRRDWAAALR